MELQQDFKNRKSQRNLERRKEKAGSNNIRSKTKINEKGASTARQADMMAAKNQSKGASTARQAEMMAAKNQSKGARTARQAEMMAAKNQSKGARTARQAEERSSKNQSKESRTSTKNKSKSAKEERLTSKMEREQKQKDLEENRKTRIMTNRPVVETPNKSNKPGLFGGLFKSNNSNKSNKVNKAPKEFDSQEISNQNKNIIKLTNLQKEVGDNKSITRLLKDCKDIIDRINSAKVKIKMAGNSPKNHQNIIRQSQKISESVSNLVVKVRKNINTRKPTVKSLPSTSVNEFPSVPKTLPSTATDNFPSVPTTIPKPPNAPNTPKPLPKPPSVLDQQTNCL